MIAATNHYEVLGIPMTAGIDEVHAAYARALKQVREQLAAGAPPPGEHLDRVRTAYRVLRESAERAAYDAALGRKLFAAAPAPPAARAATPTGAMAGDLAPTARNHHHFHFAGNGGEYFRIWIVNLLLTVLTLGIYSAWAKVRREKYFHRNLLLDGSGFDYHGTPQAILKGRALAFGLLIVVSIAENLGPVVYGIVVLALLPAVPWLVVRAFRFRAHNTSFRGLRLAFDGTYRQALRVFVGYGLLSVVTLGLCFPLWYREQKKFVLDNLRFGSARFACAVGVWPVYRIFLIPLGVLFLAAVLFGVLAAGMATAGPEALGGMMLVFVGLFVVAQLLLLPYITVTTANLVWNATTLERHGFASRMAVPSYLGVVVVNWLLTLVTLGLFWPWARVRLAAYRAASTEFIAAGSLDDFVAGETSRAAALGDEVAEMFDLDLAL